MIHCDHKFVFLRNESFYRENGRYCNTYICIDYFFCEKCLKEEVKKKQVDINEGDNYKMPDWAKTINRKVF